MMGRDSGRKSLDFGCVDSGLDEDFGAKVSNTS
jgi:hypothetical protein